MQQIIVTLAVVLIPFILVLTLRTNAAILFFVLAGASMMQTYLDKDVASFSASLLPGKNVQVISMALFTLPFAVAAIAFRKSVSSKQLMFHLILALLVGCTLVFVGPQFLPDGIVGMIRSSGPYQMLAPFTSIVIASAFLLSTVILWMSHPKHVGGKKHD